MPKSKFQVYKDEINRLMAKAGLGGGWNITFTDKKDLGLAQAEVEYNIWHRWAVFSWSHENNVKSTVQEVKRSAKHEFGHFVTARLHCLARERFMDEDSLKEEMEVIARVFERLL